MEEICNKDVSEGVKLIDDMERVFKRGREVLDGGPIYPSNYNAVTKSGEKIPVEIFTRKIEYQGEPALLSVIRNLKERRVMERQIQQHLFLMVPHLKVTGPIY